MAFRRSFVAFPEPEVLRQVANPARLRFSAIRARNHPPENNLLAPPRASAGSAHHDGLAGAVHGPQCLTEPCDHGFPAGEPVSGSGGFT
jgi:hypothetical protein